MQSKINIAEGIRREAILEGEGQAESILQEARSLCEALENISGSIVQKDGSTSEKALNLRLSEKYIDTLHQILRKSSVTLVPPASPNDGLASARNIAQISSIYKQVMGGNAAQSS